MTVRKDNSTPIFKPDANATPVSEIKPPALDPRRERVHRVHEEIVRTHKQPGRGLNG